MGLYEATLKKASSKYLQFMQDALPQLQGKAGYFPTPVSNPDELPAHYSQKAMQAIWNVAYHLYEKGLSEDVSYLKENLDYLCALSWLPQIVNHQSKVLADVVYYALVMITEGPGDSYALQATYSLALKAARSIAGAERVAQILLQAKQALPPLIVAINAYADKSDEQLFATLRGLGAVGRIMNETRAFIEANAQVAQDALDLQALEEKVSLIKKQIEDLKLLLLKAYSVKEEEGLQANLTVLEDLLQELVSLRGHAVIPPLKAQVFDADNSFAPKLRTQFASARESYRYLSEVEQLISKDYSHHGVLHVLQNTQASQAMGWEPADVNSWVATLQAGKVFGPKMPSTNVVLEKIHERRQALKQKALVPSLAIAMEKLFAQKYQGLKNVVDDYLLNREQTYYVRDGISQLGVSLFSCLGYTAERTAREEFVNEKLKPALAEFCRLPGQSNLAASVELALVIDEGLARFKPRAMQGQPGYEKTFACVLNRLKQDLKELTDQQDEMRSFVEAKHLVSKQTMFRRQEVIAKPIMKLQVEQGGVRGLFQRALGWMI